MYKFVKAKRQTFLYYRLPFEKLTARCPFCNSVCIIDKTEWPYKKIKTCKHFNGDYLGKLVFEDKEV